MAVIDLGTSNAIAVVTLATTNRVLQLDGKDAYGDWLYITWQVLTAANIVRIEFGAADGSALGTHYESKHPGTTGIAVVDIRGKSKIAISGASAFDVSVRIA